MGNEGSLGQKKGREGGMAWWHRRQLTTQSKLASNGTYGNLMQGIRKGRGRGGGGAKREIGRAVISLGLVGRPSHLHPAINATTLDEKISNGIGCAIKDCLVWAHDESCQISAAGRGAIRIGTVRALTLGGGEGRKRETPPCLSNLLCGRHRASGDLCPSVQRSTHLATTNGRGQKKKKERRTLSKMLPDRGFLHSYTCS